MGDVDPRALRFARRNLPPGAQVRCGHLLEGMPPRLRGRVTLLVAVPPYVPLPAAGLLPREAVEHEPARALFGGPDGLDLLRELLDQALPWLAPTGRVLVEIGAGQYPAAAICAERAGLRPRPPGSDPWRATLLDATPAP